MPAAWLRWTPMRLALGALVASFAVAAVMLVRALEVSPVTPGAMPVLPNPASLSAPAPSSPIDIEAIVATDVFASDRVAPTNRFLLPAEITEAAAPAFVPPRIQVLGIAMADGGRSFATCIVGTESPKIVRVGDRLGPYVVKAIESKRVTVALPGGSKQVIAPLTSGSGN